MSTSTAGVPKELCPDVNPALCCGICENILLDPVQSLECGHRFCSLCIEEKKLDSPDSTFLCPSCTREDETTIIDLTVEDAIFTDKGVYRELSRLGVSCIYCKEKMQLKTWLDTHRHNCSKRPVLCPKGCGTLVSPNELDDHYKICPEIEIKCDKCNKMVKRGEMEVHLTQRCDSLFKTCEFCGEKVLSSQLQNHTENECSVSWVKRCPYGCQNVIDLMVHRKTEVPKHLDRVYNEITKVGSQPSGDQNTPNSSIPVFEELDCKSQEKRLKAQEYQVSQMMRIAPEQELQMHAMKEEIQMLKSSYYDGTLVWRIDQFRQKQKAAKDGIQPSIFSPPFFTSRCGYQMCARLYLNGDGLGQNSHLSLFFVLMRGPYDPLLRWPFQQKVTFLLKDQKGKADVVDAFRPDPSGESFKRPVTMMNIASGSPRFLPLDDIDNADKGYVVDDVMFIRIIVDCSTLV